MLHNRIRYLNSFSVSIISAYRSHKVVQAKSLCLTMQKEETAKDRSFGVSEIPSTLQLQNINGPFLRIKWATNISLPHLIAIPILIKGQDLSTACFGILLPEIHRGVQSSKPEGIMSPTHLFKLESEKWGFVIAWGISYSYFEPSLYFRFISQNGFFERLLTKVILQSFLFQNHPLSCCQTPFKTWTYDQVTLVH